jgi:hypothetical protein
MEIKIYAWRAACSSLKKSRSEKKKERNKGKIKEIKWHTIQERVACLTHGSVFAPRRCVFLAESQSRGMKSEKVGIM